MKQKLYATIIITLFAVSGLTLSAQDDIQKVQDAWGRDKKELVRMGMMLPAADSVKFWPIYDQYEVERKKIGRERIMILSDYAEHYEQMTNAKADEIINRIFKNDALYTTLQQQYYSRMKTAINAMQAAKFLHIESYIQSTIKSALQGEIPVINKLDSLKAK